MKTRSDAWIRKGGRMVSLLLTVFLVFSGGTGALGDPNLSLRDDSVRALAPAEACLEILRERAAGIQAYQDYVLSVTSLPACRPVGFSDLTGDGVPELLFMELVHEEEFGFNVGRLWIYVWEGGEVRCALTLQPAIDDLLFSNFYLADDGSLILDFSDMEKAWMMRLIRDVSGKYAVETVLVEEQDFSGETPDKYYLDGSKISKKKYESLIAQLRASRRRLIGSLMVDDGGEGMTHTLSEATSALEAGEIIPDPLPAGGRFPELSFFPGEFTPGEKFAVYSAPSSRAYRSANGKAAITSGSEIFVAGVVNDWILVMYELSSGVTRVGYINPAKIKGAFTAGSVLPLSEEKMKLVQSTVLTDDPIRRKTSMGKLKKGASVTCLAQYRGWVYVEAKVSGQTARGFISPESLGLNDAAP